MSNERRKSAGEGSNDLFFDYRSLVRVEKERSERNNRFFILFGLVVTGVTVDKLMTMILDEIRASDYVFVTNEGNQHDGQQILEIGVLLPETDSQGADYVKERLELIFSANGIFLNMKQAIYPDDATAPEKLMEIAFAINFREEK